MEILRFFEGIRTPFWERAFQGLTLLGEEYAFLAAVLLMVWCFDKKWGFRLFFIGVAGTILNQLLKGIFLVPRPWVADPLFTIVESAREGATGYSFPSGHVQSAATMLLVLAVWQKNSKYRLAVWIASGVLTIAISVSRMYLGVHTPLDVGVSLALGALFAFLLPPVFDKIETNENGVIFAAGGTFFFSLILISYLIFVPHGVKNVPEFDGHGLESAFTLVGTTAGIFVGCILDRRSVGFETKAVWWAQILKVVLGLAVVLCLKSGLKTPLYAMTGGGHFANAIRYFVIALFGLGVWPLTFGFFSRLGGVRDES